MSREESRQSRRGAGFIFTTPDSNILLVQDRASLKWGFCKGHVEDSDTDALATAVREAHEELGAEVGTDYQVASEGFRINDYQFFYAVFTADPKSLHVQVSEIADVKVISPTDLLASVAADESQYNRYVRAWVRIISGIL
jgi:8-oxo-dGTP pyrophosphatase MutT (NUDIX family)